ncbi:Pao retrotransposon peptidase [Nesidiocoris tenuis]|uniref:Pao retrotransposon peptidase n=2 Tax=Nesidiocoris tenuis TaxID=355587 RepID=A0ABN7BCN8_9HEMI|nr:Pao retrotransposon peptidase [Nesidiocoris tenuis]
MKLVDPSDENSQPTYYVPHHPVFKETSSTTKLRVVFDFSCRSAEGLSLNDISMVGPIIQDFLYTHLIRARSYQILICGDLEKMYRGVLIHEDQTDLQRIIWRDNPDEPLRTYKLLTVSYGQSSAGWLACRTLKQLALDYKIDFPLSSEVLQKNFYLDDFICGVYTDNVNEAISLKEQVTQHLSLGKFHIRKWSSNSSTFLESIPEEDREIKSSIGFDKEGARDGIVRTLGLIWIPDTDYFTYSMENIKYFEPVTKRIALSTISKIFDPLGLLGPVTVKAKIFIQDLWRGNFSWDEPLSKSLTKRWRIFCQTLYKIKELQIPRKIVSPNARSIELHGMCDASMDAYGACVYLRCINHDGSISVSLVTSKSRVAPLKTQSLPRLELCGALLLVDLVKSVMSSLLIKIDQTFYWTDSTVVLSWLKGSPSKGATFVANRVSKIQDSSEIGQWRHVSSQDNSADLVSRGVYADELISLDLWWKGPPWLSQNIDFDSFGIFEELNLNELPEKSKQASMALHVVPSEENSHFFELISKFSSFNLMLRVFAYCIRLLRRPKLQEGFRPVGPLSPIEIADAKISLTRFVQGAMFPDELKELQAQNPVKKGSRLAALCPFLDAHGLIRVGGRLQKSSLTPDRKHPIVLSYRKSDPFSNFLVLLARYFHLSNCHVGPQSLLSIIREQYWILGGRDLVRNTYKRCVTCFRVTPKPENQVMGMLPETRIEPARPFVHAGVDYAGPFYVKNSTRKNASFDKCYISVFVCFCTKAVHLELVENLSTPAFLAALKRFISRRGKPSEIVSDNGTNFVGARSELLELETMWKSDSHRNSIVDYSSNEGILWKFNPPRSPNFGGLWESIIKQIKLLLKKVIGKSNLTFCEFNTLLIQIEAIINSRPLIPISSDPNDFVSLTPSHFLIGDTLLTPPEPDLRSLPDNRLTRWQLVQKLSQHFWARWKAEYLSELQRRCKWRTACKNLTVGTMVLLKDDQSPPLAWALGRVIEIHPGPDGEVRVVTVRTSSTTLKRSVRSLCALPIDDEDSSSSLLLKTTLQGWGNGHNQIQPAIVPPQDM